MKLFTFQNDSELCSSRCSNYIWGVLHVTVVGAVVAELSLAQLYRGVLPVEVTNELHSVFELRRPWKFLPIAEVKNLQKRGN